MDFFDHQDVARKKTGRLVALFVAAVAIIITLVYFVLVWMLRMQGDVGDPPMSWWQPLVFAYTAVGVGAVVAMSSLYKINELSGGGHVVAESLGGRLIEPSTSDFHERQMLNIVEEMAIASGTPVPPVYVMDEQGINAFAAGYSPDDAVIGVTHGAMHTLTRDEMQGVVAHEFSHILNGDMRLNIRLMGVIFGILVLTIIGYQMMRIAFWTGGSRRRSKEGNAGLAIAVLGIALIVIGGVGSLFAKLIKAAVSRQREFLADASAVQFTRNPEGISGALKKIGGWTKGSKLDHPETAEVSHMLFGDGLSHMAGNAMATHPPLAERIKRIDPQFAGEFAETHALSAAESAGASGFSGGAATQQPEADVVSQIGQPSAAHVAYAAKLLQGLPQQAKDMAHEPWGARALVFALLLDDDPQISRKQIERLASHSDDGVRRATLFLRPLVKETDEAARLPLIDLATPALRELSPQQMQQFKQNVEALAAADEKISLFEWSLQRILLSHIQPKRPRVKHQSLGPVKSHCALLLSTLSYVGHSKQDQADAAFNAGRAKLDLPDLGALKPDQCGLRNLNTALDELAAVAPKMKRKLVQACAATISADHKVTTREAELFRAICDSLGAPAPPLLPGQTLAA